MRPLRLLAGVLAAGVVLAGCGDLPTPGGVHVVRRVPPDGAYDDGPDVTKYPYGPVAGAAPDRVVLGFITAAAGQEDDPAVARDFLAPGAAWDSGSGVSVYDLDSATQTFSTSEGGRVVVAKLAQVGVVDPDGGYRPVSRQLTLTYKLRKVGSDWRITRAPPGLLLTPRDVERDYRAATIYRLARNSTLLVPDQVQLYVQSQAFPSAVVRALLRGPSRWLAPAVRSGIPDGTVLIDSATLVDNVVTVNFSRPVASLDSAQQATFLSQLVASLNTVPGVERVRVLVEGRRLLSGDGTIAVTGPPASSVASQTGRSLIYASAGGRVVRLDPVAAKPRAQDIARAAQPLSGPAVGPDGTLAALRGAQGVQQGAVEVPKHGMVISGIQGYLTSPTWVGSAGALVVGAGSGPAARLLRPGAAAAPVRISGLGREPVEQVEVSRDGTRVAAVVGEPGERYVLLGRVTGDPGQLTLDGWERLVLPDQVTDVSAVAWEDGLTLVMLGRTGRAAALWRMSLDGSSATFLSLTGVGNDVEGVAADAGRPLVLSAGGRLWRQIRTGWQAFSAGDDPSYAG